MQVLTASSSEQIILMIRAGHRSSSSKSAPTRRSLHRLSRRRPPSRPRADGARDDGRGAVPRRLPPDRAPGHRPRPGSRSGSDDDFVDPNFFDDDYSVAATTGVCRVWEGAAVLVRLLGECEALRARLRGRRVLELGAGVGSVRPRGGRRGSPRPPHGPPRGRRRGALGKRAKESTRRRRSRRRSRRRRRGRTPRRSPRRRHFRPHDDRLPPLVLLFHLVRRDRSDRRPRARHGRLAGPRLDQAHRRAAGLDAIARDALSRADAERAAGGDAAAEAFWRRTGRTPRAIRGGRRSSSRRSAWLSRSSSRSRRRARRSATARRRRRGVRVSIQGSE